MKLIQGLAPNLDVDLAPHMIEPLDAAGDNSIKELGWLWPPGAGKTTAIEGVMQWRVVCSPSNILMVGQKDDSAELWAETRLHPSFKKSEAMRPFMPENRHQNRKSTVIFPHGIYIDICGPAMANLQEKSTPWVIIEEAWTMDDKPGRMKEAEARTHDKWNSKIFYIGQAGQTHQNPDDDDSLCDLFKRWQRSTQRTFHLECSCGCQQAYKWGQLRYDKTENAAGEIDWEETAKTIRYECANPECDLVYRDNARERRWLASSLVGREQYRVMNPHARKGCEFYHCNILAIWRIPWMKSVMEFEDAMDALKRGDKEPLKIFTQKRLAEFWKPDAHEEKHELTPGGYTIEKYATGELIDNESGRGIFVDVQQKSTWFATFAFTSEGDLKLLNCGEKLTFEEIESDRIKYKVKPSCVLIDSQYRRDYVFSQCAKYGWTAFKGSGQDFFPIHMPDGTTVKAPYSTVQPVFAGSGARTNFIYFAVNPLKDTLAEIRAGRIGSLQVPDDCDKRFGQHLNAEVKRMVAFGIEKKMKEIWVRIGKRDNHLLDCGMAAVGLASVKGWIPIRAPTE